MNPPLNKGRAGWGMIDARFFNHRSLMKKTLLSMLAFFVLALGGSAFGIERPEPAPASTGETQNKGGIYLPVKGLEDIKTLSAHSKGVASVAFSPDGKTFATGSDDKTAKLWDVATGNNISTLIGHSGTVYSVAFSPDGKTLATGSQDKTVMLRDVEPRNIPKTLSGHSGTVYSVVFSPDGKTLATGSMDNTAKLWDVATGKNIKTLSAHSKGVASVAFSPGGKTLATGSDDRTATLWDVATGDIIKTLSGHSGTVRSVAFSPDGKTLATGSFDGTAKLWDVATGNIIKTLERHSPRSLFSVAFSPDGRTLASGTSHNTVEFRDVAAGNIIKTLSGHSAWVMSVAFSPDGKTLATGSDDDTAKLWDMEGLYVAEAFKKDEFESTAEYLERMKGADFPYSAKATVGTYDADRGGFDVEIKGARAFVPTNREKAREISANKENVRVSGTLRYHDKDTVELAGAALTLGPSPASKPAYAKRPAYVPRPQTAGKKPVEDIHEIPDFKAAPREADLAIVIGIERYQDIQTKSDFSRSDAGIVKDYLLALGFRERNIQFVVDEKATRSGIEKAIEGWLPNRIKKDSTVFVYYSGHGAPEPAKGDAYIVPYDGDPNYLELTGYPLKRLVERLSRLEAKEVIVLLDSCFSGAGGRSVLAKGARPLVITTEGLSLKGNMVMAAAASAGQISMSSPEKGHGLFTYHFLKALKDGKKDMAGIYGQLRPLVEDEAKELNAEQSPLLTPTPEAVKGRFVLVR